MIKKLKINGKNYAIKRLSELSVLEYSAIVSNYKHLNVLSYLSALTGLNIEKEKVESNFDILYLENILFDVDIDFEKIPVPETIMIDEKTFFVKTLDNGQFGKRYYFNLFRKKYLSKEMSAIELAVFSIAIMICDEFSDVKINEIYLKLLNQSWVKILPVGFFFVKKLQNKRNFLTNAIKRSMIRLLYLINIIKLRLGATHLT